MKGDTPALLPSSLNIGIWSMCAMHIFGQQCGYVLLTLVTVYVLNHE